MSGPVHYSRDPIIKMLGHQSCTRKQWTHLALKQTLFTCPLHLFKYGHKWYILSSKPEVREGALAPEVTYFGGHMFGDVFLVWEGGGHPQILYWYSTGVQQNNPLHVWTL